MVSPHEQRHNAPQSSIHRSSLGGKLKDLWLVVREGSVADVELALVQLKRSGGNINSRNSFGLTPLHVATWRNNVPIVKRLLLAGADPDARDGESGWSSLHRALYFGHLAVAGLLLQSGASITLEDSKSRTSVDLLSGPVSQILGDVKSSVATEVYSWGNGANYQLGTGNAHIQKLPCTVDSLHGLSIKLVSSAKFHSVAVTASGELYTWGFGRGGRLGHPEFDIHSGQAAVITPRRVISGLGSRRIRAVAAAKHHTVVATESGEVFTWGSNREGQLGYTCVDTQPTPRRVSSLRSKIIGVAAANKHTSVVSDCGEVLTWGCNKEGQLGYGTSNSASNYTPRVVEYLRGKVFTQVAAAKYHTIALGADGEVFTWGHKLVNPRRVVIARNLKKDGDTVMKFHRMERIQVVSIAAGMMHSVALTEDGALFYWVSSDPDLKCQQLYSLCASNSVCVSCGKYWSASVTSTGDIYTWDGKKDKDKPPIVTRLHGVKRATSVSVGETHLLVLGFVYHPVYPCKEALNVPKSMLKNKDEFDESFVFDDMDAENVSSSLQKDESYRTAPSLKSLSEKAAAQYLLEPRNALQLLEIADLLEASDLGRQCEEIVVHNLDYIFAISPHAISSAPLYVLARLENLLDTRSSESWSYRRLPAPIAKNPVIIDSEGEEDECDLLRFQGNNIVSYIPDKADKQSSRSFLISLDDTTQEMSKLVRALRKKLQQIDVLEAKQLEGHVLDAQQVAKLQKKSAVENSLSELGVPVESTEVKISFTDQDEKKVDLLRKQKKKKKVKPKSEVVVDCESEVGSRASKSSIDSELGIQDVADPKGMSGLRKLNSYPGSKKKSRKGGLSKFLNGGLDDPPPKIMATTRSEGPAWGGAKVSSGASSSIREIQDEQRKSSGKIPLSLLSVSKPIPMVSTHPTNGREGDRNSTPPWAASGTPPLVSQPSLRDIQIQQGKKQFVSYSPKSQTAGFSLTTSESAGSPNRWLKPDMGAAPSTIRSIQVEQKAMKDMRRDV